jgi:hypothetical protein
MASGRELKRRTFLGLILAAAAALTAGRLGFSPSPPAADTPPEQKPAPRGWREARHWRKI